MIFGSGTLRREPLISMTWSP